MFDAEHRLLAACLTRHASAGLSGEKLIECLRQEYPEATWDTLKRAAFLAVTRPNVKDDAIRPIYEIGVLLRGLPINIEYCPLQKGVSRSAALQDGESCMAHNKNDEANDVICLHEWFSKVGGNIDLGQSFLKSLEISKDGDKITIVLKKKKAKKDAKTDGE
jgi:hypothetical protein